MGGCIQDRERMKLCQMVEYRGADYLIVANAFGTLVLQLLSIS